MAGVGLRSVSMFIFVRRGDLDVYHRLFSIPEDKCRFVRCPAPNLIEAGDGSYIYSAGWAHRDWELLFDAVRPLPYPTIVAAEIPTNVQVPENVTILAPQSPESGQKFMADSAVVATNVGDRSVLRAANCTGCNGDGDSCRCK